MSLLEAERPATPRHDPTGGAAGREPVPISPPTTFSTVLVIGAIVLTMVVVLGLLVLVAPSAGAAGGCGGG